MTTIDRLAPDEVVPFVDELWLPAQREMAGPTDHALADDVRENGLAHRRERLATEGTVTFVARGDGGGGDADEDGADDALADDADRLGFASAAVRTPPPIFEPRREAHTNELFVRPAARRDGVASALLDAVEEWAAATGCADLDLNVHRDNEAARSLYETAGYEVARYNMRKPVDGEE
ncbi:MAG: GNAT family N-acetyltransferase [Halolamina sp.]